MTKKSKKAKKLAQSAKEGVQDIVPDENTLKKVKSKLSEATLVYLLTVLNFILISVGVVMLALGVYLKLSYGSWFAEIDGKLKHLPTHLMTMGLSIGGISIFGIFCIIKRPKVIGSCLLYIFSTLVMGTIFHEIFVGIMFLEFDEAKVSISDGIEHGLRTYGGDDAVNTALWDKIQHSSKCCGSYSYIDWNDPKMTSWGAENGGRVPDSCCVDTGCSAKITKDANKDAKIIYTDGCRIKIEDSLQQNVYVILSTLLVLVVLQVIVILLSDFLARVLRKKKLLGIIPAGDLDKVMVKNAADSKSKP